MSPELINTLDEEDRLRFVLGGGDDYELCFTAPSADFFASGEVAGVAVTRIGQVGKGSGLSCTRDGKAYDYHDDGYRHFS